MTKVYNTVREAGIAGAREAIILGRRDNWEYGGWVLPNPDGDGYILSEIVTTKQENSVVLTEALPDYLRDKKFPTREARGAAIVGIFHVHIKRAADKLNDFFSPQDIQQVIGNMALSYLGVTDTGKVFELDGRNEEGLKETAQELVVMAPKDMPSEMVFLLAKISGEAPPMGILGLEVFAGDQEEVCKAA